MSETILVGTYAMATEEQVARWKRAITDDPSSVVNAVRSGLLGGDVVTTIETLPAVREGLSALEALCYVTQESEEIRARNWSSLVDHGAVETLCDVIVEHRVHWEANRGLDEPCSWHTPIYALFIAAIHLSDPPTEQDKRFLSVMRAQWSRMMKRIWEQPETYLESTPIHIRERAVTSMLLNSLIEADPSFESIIFEPSDFTIPVIAREWFHSTADMDVSAGEILCRFLARRFANIETPSPSPFSAVFQRLLLGVGWPSIDAPFGTSVQMVSAFAAHLNQFEGEIALRELGNLHLLLRLTQKRNCPDFLSAVRGCRELWRAVFGLLPRPSPAGEDDSAESDTTFVCNVVLVLISAALTDGNARETDLVMPVWVQEGIFDMLDSFVPAFLPVDRATSILAKLFMKMLALAVQDPSFRGILRSQLPRSRLMSALIRHDRDLNGALPVAGSRAAISSSATWDHEAWICLAKLDRVKVYTHHCQRRGCNNPERKRCAGCLKTTYLRARLPRARLGRA